MVAPAMAVGELVSPEDEFICCAKSHPQVDEVRLSEMQEVVDHRFREGIRMELHWSGYCACCGRRVEVTRAAA